MKTSMKFLSICSGIEAASQAFIPLGMEPIGFSEIEPFPCAVLKHRHPNVPNFGDMTKYHEWPTELRPDILCGGTPCQGFSLAGLRAGLDDPRSQLSLVFVEIAARYRPRWVVWENVPGVLSSEGGADFATLLAAFTGRDVQVPENGWANSGHIEGIPEAYGIAWRVLDAQHAGVPQRRRRVFVVGYLGDWRRAAAVLFERHSMQGHSPPSRQAGQSPTYDVAPCIGASGRGFERTGDTRGQDSLVPEVSPTLDAMMDRKWGSNQWVNNGFAIIEPIIMSSGQANAEINADGTLGVSPRDAYENNLMCVHGTQDPCVDPHLAFALGRNSGQENAIMFQTRGSNIDLGQDVTGTIGSNCDSASGGAPCIAFAENSRAELRLEGGDGTRTGAVTSGGGKPGQGVPCVASSMMVRRLTPRECERLQGFPDDWTLIPRGKKTAEECPDGPRYKSIGNSWAVPCARWIGKRILMIEKLTTLEKQP